MNKSRPKQMAFRLSDEELEIVRDKIEESGLTQQEYLLKCALDKPVVTLEPLRDLNRQLKKVGNNLNQIAHSLNSDRYYDYKLISQNQEELRALWQQLSQSIREVR